MSLKANTKDRIFYSTLLFLLLSVVGTGGLSIYGTVTRQVELTVPFVLFALLLTVVAGVSLTVGLVVSIVRTFR